MSFKGNVYVGQACAMA